MLLGYYKDYKCKSTKDYDRKYERNVEDYNEKRKEKKNYNQVNKNPNVFLKS